jgi:hypothetical protein
VAQLVVLPAALIWLYRGSPAIYRQLRDTVLATWLIAVPIFALFPVAPTSRLGVPRRLAVALPTLGCVLALLAPNQASASSLTARHETQAGSTQSHHARHAQGPLHAAVAAPAGPACVRPPTVYPSWSSSS